MTRPFQQTPQLSRWVRCRRLAHTGLWALLLGMASLPALAQGASADHEQEQGILRFDDRLSLHALFEGARQRHPELGILDAQQQRASAESRFADRWFPDSASAFGYHLSDRPLDDFGMYEDELAMSLPLWMPGEKRARTRLAEATAAVARNGAADFDWRVSGEVREALWKVLQARRAWELAVAQEADLAELLNQAQLLEETGEISRGDRLAVLQQLGSWRAETLSKEAEYQDAVRGYRALSGAAELPAAFEEMRSSQEGITDDHPALQLAREQVTEVSALLDSVQQGNNFRPSIQIYWRNTRPDERSPADAALGVGFELPLGRSPSRGPEAAMVNEALARAQAQLLRQQRELQLQLHEAEHTLHTIELQLDNSAELMAAAESRRELDALELELGEIPVQEWLRRLVGFRAIQRDHELLQLRHGAAVAAYNQAVGESL